MKMASGGGTPSRWGIRVIPEVFDPVSLPILHGHSCLDPRQSHRLFNPAPPMALLTCDSRSSPLFSTSVIDRGPPGPAGPGERGAPAAFAGQPHNPGPWPPKSQTIQSGGRRRNTRGPRGRARGPAKRSGIRDLLRRFGFEGFVLPGNSRRGGSKRCRWGGSLLHAVHDLVR